MLQFLSAPFPTPVVCAFSTLPRATLIAAFPLPCAVQERCQGSAHLRLQLWHKLNPEASCDSHWLLRQNCQGNTTARATMLMQLA